MQSGIELKTTSSVFLNFFTKVDKAWGSYDKPLSPGFFIMSLERFTKTRVMHKSKQEEMEEEEPSDEE